MNKNEEQKGFRFNPVISFDGVAILLAVFVGAIAWGQMKQQVSMLAETSKEHTAQLRTLSDTTSTLAAIMHANEHN